MKKLVEKNIEELVPYQPGKPIEELERELGISGTVKLASNENPVGPSRKAIEGIIKELHKLNRYPDGGCYYLKKKLAAKLGFKEENIIFGNGSNEIIELIVRTFMKKDDQVIMADPSFVVYKLIVKAANGISVPVPLKNFCIDLDGILGAVTDKTRIIFLANPNNPTGTIFRKKEFERFLSSVPEDIITVIDEAYAEYVTDSEFPDSLRYQNGKRNLITLRTFSKIYGLAGLRIGYGIAKPEIIEYMNRVRQPFNVNSLAQIGAFYALDDDEHVLLSQEVNRKGLEYLYSELDKMGIEYIRTQANFFLINVKADGHLVYKMLQKEGVIVRPMGGFGLKEFIRVTVGLAAENEKFIKALKKVLSEIK